MAKKIATRDAIAAMLAEIGNDQIQEGEFTARMVFEEGQKAGSSKSITAIRQKLAALAESGKLRVRLANIDGRMQSVYRHP